MGLPRSSLQRSDLAGTIALGLRGKENPVGADAGQEVAQSVPAVGVEGVSPSTGLGARRSQHPQAGTPVLLGEEHDRCRS